MEENNVKLYIISPFCIYDMSHCFILNLNEHLMCIIFIMLVLFSVRGMSDSLMKVDILSQLETKIVSLQL